MSGTVVHRWFVSVGALLAAVGLAVGTFPSEAAAQSDASAENEKEQASAAEEEEQGAEATSEASTPSYQYELRDATLVVRADGEEVHSVDIPCEPTAGGDESSPLERQGGHVFVACGNEGIYLFDIGDPKRPEGLGLRLSEGKANGFFRRDGKLWVRVGVDKARPADESAGDEIEDKPETSTDDGELTGTAVQTRPGVVVIDLGHRDGLKSGDRLEFYRIEYVENSTGETEEQTETIAIGRASNVREKRSEVTLGMNEAVEVDTKVRQVHGDETTANMFAPPRNGGMASFAMTLRPTIPLDALGLGVAGDARFQWAFRFPALLEVQAQPIGVGFGNQPAVGAFAGDVSLSYDSRLLRIGLGIGGSGIATPRRAFGSDAPLNKFGATVIQVARFGARDGAHLKIHNNLIAFDGGFRWGDIDISGRVPAHMLLENTWFIGRGAHQRAGQTFGEIGMRVMTSGNGGKGSTFLEATIGGGGVWGESVTKCSDPDVIGDTEGVDMCTKEDLYAGPMIGLGFEQRF